MLHLHVSHQQPKHHLLPALPALHPTPLPLPVISPYPVILLLYAASKCVPAWHGRKTMPTVFLELVHSPTLSNRPAKVLKYPWIHRGSNDENMPLSTYKREF